MTYNIGIIEWEQQSKKLEGKLAYNSIEKWLQGLYPSAMFLLQMSSAVQRLTIKKSTIVTYKVFTKYFITIAYTNSIVEWE